MKENNEALLKPVFPEDYNHVNENWSGAVYRSGHKCLHRIWK